MTTQTVEPQTANVADAGPSADGTTLRTAWVDHTPTPDLIAVFDDAKQEAAERDAEIAATGFRAVFEWAVRQDFAPDHAERMRREAWGRSSE